MGRLWVACAVLTGELMRIHEECVAGDPRLLFHVDRRHLVCLQLRNDKRDVSPYCVLSQLQAEHFFGFSFKLISNG